MTGDIDRLAETIFSAVKTYCGVEFDTRAREIVKAIDERFASSPVPKDGKDADPEVIKAEVQRAVAALPVAKDADEEAIARRVLAEIPVPKDGKDGRSIEPAEIEFMVKLAASELPKPADGKDADADAIAAKVLEQVTGALPAPKDGKDADPELIRLEVAKAVEALPKPKDGRSVEPDEIEHMVRLVAAELPKPADGKDADPDLIRAEVERAVAQIPKPSDGRDADEDAITRRVLSAINVPKDGKDADPEFVKAEVERAVAAIPKPKDGESVPLEVVTALIVGEVSKQMQGVSDGRDGRDGEPGRDAFAIDVLPAIDTTRRYQRGAWAKHAGGLWLARSQTDGMNGWDCIVEGDAEETVELADDMRTLKYRKVKSGGAVIERTFRVPTMIHREVWREKEYEQGDAVTWGGGTWVCRAERTTQKPGGESRDWFLSVKPGRDGKDGIRGEKGDRGSEGRAGKDTTQMDFNGNRT